MGVVVGAIEDAVVDAIDDNKKVQNLFLPFLFLARLLQSIVVDI